MRSIATAFLGLALVGLLAAVTVGWYFALRQRTATSSAELLELETRWMDLSQQVEAAEQTRHGFDVLAALPKRIIADREAPRLAPALRSIAMAAGAGIELQGIQVGGEMDETGARELQIDGIATGEEARGIADRFRQALEADLKQQFPKKPVTARFDRIEDEADSATSQPGQRRASFTIIAASQIEAPEEPEQSINR